VEGGGVKKISGYLECSRGTHFEYDIGGGERKNNTGLLLKKKKTGLFSPQKLAEGDRGKISSVAGRGGIRRTGDTSIGRLSHKAIAHVSKLGGEILGVWGGRRGVKEKNTTKKKKCLLRGRG